MKRVLSILVVISCLAGQLIAGTNSAQFIWQSVPNLVTVSEVFTVKYTVKNTGTNVWQPNGSQSWWIGSANPRDNFVWGTNRGHAVETTVNPNETYTFTFQLTAPSTSGVYNCQWQMLQNFVEWFGASSNNTQITVVPNGDYAQFISQTAPSSAIPGENVTIKLRYKNTGSTTWIKGVYCLASENAPGNTTWGTSRIELPYNVAPGVTVDIVGNLQAPTTEGIHLSQWRLSKGGAHRFGPISNTKSVSVNHVYAGYGLAISAPKSVTAGQSFSIDFRFKNTGSIAWNNLGVYISGGSYTGNQTVSAPVGGTATVRANFRAPNYFSLMFISAHLSGPNGPFGEVTCMVSVDGDITKSTAASTNPIADVAVNNSFSISPNPASEILKIQLPETKENTSVKLIDILGKVVLERTFKNKDLIELTVSDFAKGMYILYVQSGTDSYKEKIILK